jgi:hypothetical protein
MAWGEASDPGCQRRGCEKAAPTHVGFWNGKHDDLSFAEWIRCLRAKTE